MGSDDVFWKDLWKQRCLSRILERGVICVCIRLREGSVGHWCVSKGKGGEWPGVAQPGGSAQKWEAEVWQG